MIDLERFGNIWKGWEWFGNIRIVTNRFGIGLVLVGLGSLESSVQANCDVVTEWLTKVLECSHLKIYNKIYELNNIEPFWCDFCWLNDQRDQKKKNNVWPTFSLKDFKIKKSIKNILKNEVFSSSVCFVCSWIMRPWCFSV